MISRRSSLFLMPAGAWVGATVLALGGAPAAPQSQVNTLDSRPGVAIKGFDPVAYFVSGKPMSGKPEHAVLRDGATWYFASESNKALFEKDPQKYVPAYGGYCAFGVSQGYLVKIEPEAWSIRDGRLYLNYDIGTRKKWEENQSGYIETANRKWPRLIDK